jgi:hypothetical protein
MLWGFGMDDNNLINDRDALLDRATADVRKWCAPSETMVNKKNHPDTYWIELLDFENSSEIAEKHAIDFLVSFQLTRYVSWYRSDVAALMSRVRSLTAFVPKVHVPSLAEELRACNSRRTRQTSAASKIAAFSKPRAKVFIWDSLASRSARWRDWKRGLPNRERPSSALYTLADGEHDYSAFYAACERALEDDRNLPDFRNAVELLEREFFRGGGVMGNRAKIPIAFIERRLLDKLMFWEGGF